MTTRQETKDILLNEFADPMTLGLIAAGIGGAAALYTGHKRGQDPTLPYKGARWRVGQALKKVGAYAGSVASKTVMADALEDTDKWHKKIADAYGPTVRYDQYKNALASHQALIQSVPDRADLIQKHNKANETAVRIANGYMANQNRRRELLASGVNQADIGKQKFNASDPSPTAETVDQHLARHDAKNVDIDGNVIAPGTTGVDSLHAIFTTRSNLYVHPALHTNVTDASGKKLTIGDVYGMTPLEKLDAQNPIAAQFRERVTRDIIEPKAKHIATLQGHTQLASQSIAAHRSTMKADKDAQRAEMDITRAALPPVFDPTASKWEIAKRVGKKAVRNKAIDRLRSSIG